MNRRQFLTSVASVGVSAALPANSLPIPETISPIDELEALDSRREPWQAGDAGDVPVQE